MNALQKTELDIFKVFLDICEKHDLMYFMVCGSALGAVKYHGFIPWDDDMDIGMPRKDYERFLKIAPAVLPKELFLQNYQTDPAFPHVFTKLRNSNTTFVEKGLMHLDINHGVYIDIFPLDGHPKNKFGRFSFEIKQKWLNWKRFCNVEGDFAFRVRMRNQLFRLFGCHKKTQSAIEKLEKLYCKYPVEESELLCNYGNSISKLEYSAKEIYGGGVWMEFEGLRVRIPEQYELYLTQKYGDWKNDLDKDLQQGHHFYHVMDLEHPFTEYMKKL